MRYSLILLMFAVAFTACQSDFEGYEISGKIANAPSKTLKLQKVTLSKITDIDTATIKEDGSFAMKGILDEKGLFRLLIDNRTYWTMVLGNDKVE
ncbi:MAG: DUF4369 domain-containing protein, partial [Chitinophagales bacterium]|nr:DUF4369 domain-containing protein [Chitinophagales bacterium]